MQHSILSYHHTSVTFDCQGLWHFSLTTTVVRGMRVTSSLPTLSSHPPCLPLLRQTVKRVCLYGDPKGPASISGGVEVIEESPGVRTVCAQFRDPFLTAAQTQMSYCSSSSSLFIPPQQWEAYAEGTQGWAEGDFLILKKKAAIFRLSKSLVIHLMTCTGPAYPPS